MSIHTNIGGTWRDVTTAPQVNIGRVWRSLTTGHVNIGGTQRLFYEDEIKESDIVGFNVIAFQWIPGTYAGVVTESASSSQSSSYWTYGATNPEGDSTCPRYSVHIFARHSNGTLYKVLPDELNGGDGEYSTSMGNINYMVSDRLKNRIIRMTGYVDLSWSTGGSVWNAWFWGYGYLDGALTTSPTMPGSRSIINQIIWPTANKVANLRYPLMGGYFTQGTRQMTFTAYSHSFTVDGVSKSVTYQFGGMW